MSRRLVLERGVHVAVLWALAVAGPLFDTLGGNPEFFAVRAASPGEIVAFALLVTFVPPLALLAAEWLVGLVSEAAAWALHVVFVAALSAAVVLGVLSLGTAPALALALVAGIAAAIVYVRFPPARTLLTVLGPAPLAFVALFLLVSDASDLVFPASADVQAVHVRSSAPVVLVIFDEFPVHSLMGPDGRIDARRYPNFARLARDATWYRNTASVDQDTPYAVPAILDGRLPRQERLPVAADHPRNVFSLLAGRGYELHVNEDATALCSPALCIDREDVPLWDGVARTVGHELLPDEVEDELDPGEETPHAVAVTRLVPRESKRHRFVRIHANLAHDRPARFEQFVSEIEDDPGPRLHLIHILLPHVPYQYLPSGRVYRRTAKEALPGIDGRPGYASPFVVQQAYQRHLLQVAATDRLLGELLDRLQRTGIYDRAVVAVVADHGISFRLGHDRRLLRRANLEDIAPVPFLLKVPGQKRGRISDRRVQTIDVLPTIADALGIRIPWRVDGRSALAPPQARRREMVSKKFKHTYLVDTPAFARRNRAALERKLALFGDGIYSFGPRPDLIGRRVPTGGRRVVVDRDSGFVPAHQAGAIEGGRRGGGRTVAIAVNGRVVATGTTFTLEGARDEQYSVLVPEHAFRQGVNRVQVLLASGARLLPAPRRRSG